MTESIIALFGVPCKLHAWYIVLRCTSYWYFHHMLFNIGSTKLPMVLLRRRIKLQHNNN